MFRALLCPSSGALSNCLCSLWLPYDCRVGRASSCGRFTSKLLCPSSGAIPNCFCSLWLPYDCRVGRASSCGRFTSKRDQAINIKWIVHLVGCFIEWKQKPCYLQFKLFYLQSSCHISKCHVRSCRIWGMWKTWSKGHYVWKTFNIPNPKIHYNVFPALCTRIM
jgi:hypothetical protein